MSFLHGNGCLIKAAFNGDLMTVLIADKRMEIKQKGIAIKTTPSSVPFRVQYESI